MDDSNILAFPSRRSNPVVSTRIAREPQLSEELTELARLNRRLIRLTEQLGERLLEQEEKTVVLERRLLQLAKMFSELKL